MHNASLPAGAPRARRWLRSLTALALPATTLALVGLGAPAHAANPAQDCVLSGSAFACTLNYGFTGAAQTFQVPNGVTGVDVVAIGAAGGNYSGANPGRGARVTGRISVSPGATYQVMVGGRGDSSRGGFNGGAASTAGANGGGGATDLRADSTLASRVVVAGGGGGADLRASHGGDAGLVGADGVPGTGSTGAGGLGGTQTAGGAGGVGSNGTGAAGALGVGGTGANAYGGGGGGGLYGGGGGGGSANSTGSGGGGGSSLVPAGGAVSVAPSVAAGSMSITYSSPLAGSDLALGAPSVAAGVANPVSMTVTDGVVTAATTPQTLTIAPTGGTTGASCTATSCSATGLGTYTVTATFGTQTQKATFAVVAGPAAEISVSPADTTVDAGAPATYTVSGTDAYGHDLGDLTQDSLVTVDSGAGGSDVACDNGVCSVEKVGDYTVSASTPGAGGTPATATATLHVEAAPLGAITLSPSTATIASGQSRSYTVAGGDRYGNDLGDVTGDATISFTPVGGGDATTCATATCAPTAAGTYVVTATVGDATATSTLVVQPRSTSVTVEPVTGAVFGGDVPVAASITAGGTVPTGTVQFSLDGAPLGQPVTLDGTGNASLPAVSGLHAGAHALGATYASADGSFERGADVTAFLVEKAPSTTTLSVAPGTLTASVAGAGAPTGSVEFYVDGVSVGSAPVVDGLAVLTGTANDGGSVVGASYGGDADHAASAASTARKGPVVTARPTGAGTAPWFSGPVTVTFSCDADAVSCPEPVVLSKEGVGQYVTRTVVGKDGGLTTVTAGPYALDLTAPVVSISRVGDGKTYKGRARLARCVGGDVLSGLRSCTVETTGGPFGAVTSTVTATDVAGNTTTRTASYRVLDVWVARSSQDEGAWSVGRGARRTLHVMSTSAPRLKGSGAVRTSGFTMVGRRGGISHWVATVAPERSLAVGRVVPLRLTSSQGTQTVRISVTR